MWIVDAPSLALVLAGAVHLGLVSLFDIDLVSRVFGHAAKIVFDLVGAAGIWQIWRQRWH